MFRRSASLAIVAFLQLAQNEAAHFKDGIALFTADSISVMIRCRPREKRRCFEQIKEILADSSFSVENDFQGTDLLGISMPSDLVEEIRSLGLVQEAHESVEREMLQDIPIDPHSNDGRRKQIRWDTRQLKEYPSSMLDFVNAQDVWNLSGGRGTKGAGAKVCVVEDGIAEAHEDLDYSKIIAEPEMIGRGKQFEHGLRVTGVISAIPNNNKGVSGIAPEAEIIGVEWDKAGGTENDVIAALRECKEKGADIITFSVGGFRPSQEEADYCQQILDDGILLVGASGNFHGYPKYDGLTYYPPHYNSFLTVGSVSWSGNISSFSSRGASVDLVAPGENVRVLSKASTSTSVLTSGTSFSAPLVAGAAALLKSLKPSATPAQLKDALIKTATRPDHWTVGMERDNDYGYGTINVLKAAEHILQINDCGNGRLDVDEECDDENTDNGDGCSIDCKIEKEESSDSVKVVVSVNTKRFASDTSWEITDKSGKVVRSHSNFTNAMTKSVDLDLPRGCYDFTIKDSFGDGLCCHGGIGHYEIKYDGQTQIKDYGFKGVSKTSKFGACSSGQCSAMLNLKIHTDQYSSRENTVKVENMATGEMIVDITSGLPSDSAFLLEACAEPSQCYKLAFSDSYGDGILKRPSSFDSRDALSARFNDKDVLEIPFSDSCRTRCVYMGSCSDRKCEPTGCGERRLRGNRDQ